jgi:DNA processing protein
MVLGDSHHPEALLNLDDPPLMLYPLGAASFKNNSHLAITSTASIATDNVAFCAFFDTAKSLAMGEAAL